jgi:hypothetical protein
MTGLCCSLSDLRYRNRITHIFYDSMCMAFPTPKAYTASLYVPIHGFCFGGTGFTQGQFRIWELWTTSSCFYILALGRAERYGFSLMETSTFFVAL